MGCQGPGGADSTNGSLHGGPRVPLASAGCENRLSGLWSKDRALYLFDSDINGNAVCFWI